MPKRKHKEDDYEYLAKKLRKLERKVKYAKRRRRESSSASSRSSRSITDSYEDLPMEYEESEHQNPVHLEEDAASTSQRALNSIVVVPDLITNGENSSTNVDETTEVTKNPTTDNAAVASTPVSENIEATSAIADLDPTILEILGDDPTKINTFGSEIQKDLAVRLEHCATSGLNKDAKKELMEKMLIPSNCKLINAPALNPEIKAALADLVTKRDKAIEIRQTQLAKAISSLSQILTRIMSNTDKDTELIKMLMDTCKILCDCQYSDSVTRRNFILSALKKDMKEHVQNTKIDTNLFGQNLSETLKTAKIINKSGAELKASQPPKQPVKKPSAGQSKTLNWKGPLPVRRQTEVQRTKEPASHKYRQSNSSRQSQQHHRDRPQRSRR